MSLEKLQQIEAEARDRELSAQICDRACSDLAKIRTGPYTLTGAIDEVFRRWFSGSDAAAKKELFAVIDEMASDIYRIAEMRLAAKGRFYKVQAAQKRAIVTASILPIPELEEKEVF